MHAITRATKSALLTAIVFLAGAGGLDAQHADHTDMFDGVWDVTFTSQMGEMTLQFDLESDGQEIFGVATSQAGEGAVAGSQDGDDVAFTLMIDQPDHQVELFFSGKVDGDAASGDVSIMGDTFDWTAKRATG